MDDQLWDISNSANENEKLDIASYFESVDPHKAIAIYHRAGMLHKALQLAFKFDLMDSVELISIELNPEEHSDLLEQCGEYFLNKEQFDVAVKLIASSKKYDEAVSVCLKEHVTLTEEMCDLLTPPTNHPTRIELLNKLGEYAFMQGNYHLSAKQFIQAGNKSMAMKALLKSGDTEKIIFFANVSREKEVYIMAANYLQTLDWQAQPEFLKHIINFYNKAKSPHLLANFYVACAQIEVDEYGNYDKSIGALNEASRCLNKNPEKYASALEFIVKKINSVKKFLEIKKMFDKGDGDVALLQAKQLLNSDLELVRRGDIYSVMIEYLTGIDNWSAASQIALDMKKNLPNDDLLYYVPRETLIKLGLEIEDLEATQDVVLEEIEDVTVY